MITVSIGGKEIVVKPKSLLNYVEKLDFIKSRRTRPWDLIQGFPDKITPENYKILVEIAMRTVYTQSSSVSIEEELSFDKSEEGFFYELWKCLPPDPKEDWKGGLNRAKAVWDSGTPDEKSMLRIAMIATDERLATDAKNSAGPSSTPDQPGHQEPSEVQS